MTPPYACDRCRARLGDPRRAGLFGGQDATLVPLHAAPTSVTERVDPRHVAWLCPPCRREVRAIGETIDVYWTWPGPRRPRMTRWVTRLDPRAHENALGGLDTLPERERARTYCQRYLAALPNPQAWLARVLVDAERAVPMPALVPVWRAYAAEQWDLQRRRAERDEPVGSLALPALRQRAVRTTQQPIESRTTTQARPAARPYDERAALTALDEAEAAFDQKVAEILARLERGA